MFLNKSIWKEQQQRQNLNYRYSLYADIWLPNQLIFTYKSVTLPVHETQFSATLKKQKRGTIRDQA